MKSKMLPCVRIPAICITAAVICSLSSCSPEIFLNHTLVHTKDNIPVPDAVVYAEVWKNNKPVNFTFGITGNDGKIPSQPVIPIPVTNGALGSLSVFADGYACTIVSRAIAQGKYQLTELVVERKKNNNVTLPGNLAFPFDGYPGLLKKLKNPACRPLFTVWMKEFNYIFDNSESLPLYLQERLPKMKVTIEELKKYHKVP